MKKRKRVKKRRTLPSRIICNDCRKVVEPGAKYATFNKLNFHWDHFRCSICKSSLHDQPHYQQNSRLYCYNDYVKKFCKTCRTCRKKILGGGMFQAFGEYYHAECFVCKSCGNPLEDGRFKGHKGQPYCEQHFNELTCPPCKVCNKPVVPEECVMIRAEAKKPEAPYHVNCLSCVKCNCPLAGKTISIDCRGNFYCKEDFVRFVAKDCAKCGKPITGKCFFGNEGNDSFHPECLRCHFCHKTLTKYICFDGYLRCDDHAKKLAKKSRCDLCHALMEAGEVVMSCGKRLHRACFKCALCKTKLCGKKARLSKGSIICRECNEKGGRKIQAPDEKEEEEKEKQHEKEKEEEPKKELLSVAVPVILPEVHEAEIKWIRGPLIGKGGFGRVYQAMDKENGKLFAVKQVKLNKENASAADDLERESRIMKHVRHANIINVLAFQRTKKRVSILMEFAAGKSLDAIVKNYGVLNENVMRHHVRQLLDALAFCHSKGVIHRDIKAKNILVDRNCVKIADFGSAKKLAFNVNDAATRTHVTPLWTAPEVFSPTGTAYNCKVDIWSLGCTVIEMATGKLPWHEQDFGGNVFGAIYHIANTKETPRIPENLSEDGKAFMRLCFTRDPKKRPSAEELLKHPWLNH